MKPQAEFRKVLVVWAIIVGLVIVAMAVGKWMWKARETEKRDAAQSTTARETLAEVTKAIECLLNGKRDLITGAITLAVESPSDKICGEHAEPLQRRLEATAEKLGMKLDGSPPMPYWSDFENPSQLEEMCTWVGEIVAHANQIASKVRLARIAIPTCEADAHGLELVAAPDTLGGNSISEIRAGTELRLQYRDERRDGYVIARTTDGADWQSQPLPPRWFAGYAWTDDVFVATISERPEDDNSPYLVNVLGPTGQWVRRGKLDVPVVDSVHVVSKTDIVLVTNNLADGTPPMLLRSSDGGRTFPRRTKLTENEPTIRGLEVQMLPDGTAIALIPRESANLVFDVVKVGAAEEESRTLHRFTWGVPDATEHPALQTCRDGDVRWALVRGKHLVASDGGLDWALVKHFPHALNVAAMACGGSRLAIAAGSGESALWSCDRKGCANPIAFRRSDNAATAVRFDGDKLALWVGTSFSHANLRTGEPALIAVYRLDGAKLVLDRVHVAESSGKLPVVRDKRGFFAL